MLDCFFFLSAKSIGWVVLVRLAPPALGQKAARLFLEKQGTDPVTPVTALRGRFTLILPTGTEASVGPRGGRSWAGRVHRCTLCDYATSQPESLAQHGMWHRGEPPFKCSQCDKRFFQRSSASAHLRTHTGERPFRCCFCTRSFVVKGDLTRHVRTHTGERPFRCRHCPRAFSDQGNLLKHERKCH
ncbi:hypothetical protein HPB47_023364 [Ixodes persulcatus]|uniref:Uncharacterized protein n=1 Tax=Ixodes persulcatus TaxID=34615 RepID=A0AC60Q7W3_IXOPE|nr:hypothetical protein HPB47_023364 [Ixodes persulcatus]